MKLRAIPIAVGISALILIICSYLLSPKPIPPPEIHPVVISQPQFQPAPEASAVSDPTETVIQPLTAATGTSAADTYKLIQQIQTEIVQPSQPQTDQELTEFQTYFQNNIVNNKTIQAFKILQTRFNTESGDIEQHYAEVLAYLKSQLGQAKAEEAIALYKQFTEYEMGLTDQVHLWDVSKPRDSSEALQFLERVQRHREQHFGYDNTEILWGEELRSYEYQLRRHDIITDEYSSGREKQVRLADLRQELWGDQAEEKIISSPYSRYQEKLQLYRQDLERMTDQEKYELMKQFRHEIFPAEAAARMDARERQRLAEQGIIVMD